MPDTKRKPPFKDCEAAWDQFVKFLRDRGDRVTHSRHIVFQRVMAQTEHFRADDLAAQLVSGSDRVSRGTVYRTLNLMVDSGYVRKVRDDNRHSHYEPVRGDDRHEHMICRECGKILEFEEPEMEQLIARKCREMGFEELRHRVTVIGLCADCAES